MNICVNLSHSSSIARLSAIYFLSQTTKPTWILRLSFALLWGSRPLSSAFSPLYLGCDHSFRTNWTQNTCSGLTGGLAGLLSNQLTFLTVLFMPLSHLAPHNSHSMSLSDICTFHPVGVPPGVVLRVDGEQGAWPAWAPICSATP